jgi:hypothetical protein
MSIGSAAPEKLSQLNPTTGGAVGPSSFKGLSGRVLDFDKINGVSLKAVAIFG